MKVSEQQGGCFLQPSSVGSHVQWYVVLSENFNNDGKLCSVNLSGSVSLGDCSRNISWGLDDNAYNSNHVRDVEDDVAKIDRAIAELQKLKVAYLSARKVFDKRVKNLPAPKDET